MTHALTVADEIAQAPGGARFIRADLHIHSYGGSHDVIDTTFTPTAIVENAAREGLRLIAITDHNEITNVASAVASAAGKDVAVIPGIVLSTPQGHLLVYFESFEQLQNFYGGLQFADRGTDQSRCQTALLDCLNRVHTKHQ